MCVKFVSSDRSRLVILDDINTEFSKLVIFLFILDWLENSTDVIMLLENIYSGICVVFSSITHIVVTYVFS